MNILSDGHVYGGTWVCTLVVENDSRDLHTLFSGSNLADDEASPFQRAALENPHCRYHHYKRITQVQKEALRAGPDTQPITFKPKSARKLSVYNYREAELSAGDKVRISRNDAQLDLVNGQRADVLDVTPTTVTLGIGDAPH